MNISEYILYILPLILLPLLLLWLWKFIARLKYLQKLARLNILFRQQKLDGKQIYSSWIIERCVHKLYFSLNKNGHIALAQLVGGRIKNAVSYIQEKDAILAALLMAHLYNDKAYKMLLSNRKVLHKQRNFAALRPLVAWQMFKHGQAQTWLKETKRRKLKASAQAYDDFALTQSYLQIGDMKNATRHIMRAIKFFRRAGYPIEEASGYMKLAEIYRLCCMNDVAQTMIEAAYKIYEKHQAPLHLSDVVSARGMLMLFENRFDEAEACYEQASMIAPTEKMRADISNQQALLALVRGQVSTALRKVRQTGQFYSKTHNDIGLAFSLQLEGQAELESQHYQKAVRLLLQATDLYLKLRNYTAYTESAYSAANALCKQKKYAKAERLLQELLSKRRCHQSGFYIANIYGLLGLINMETGNLQTAEDWLQKSLKIEQREQRDTGMAVDYINLAIIKQLEGNIDKAHQYSKQAIEYATKTEDEEFIKLIKDKILH